MNQQGHKRNITIQCTSPFVGAIDVEWHENTKKNWAENKELLAQR